MKEQLREITDKTLEKIKGISTREELNDIRVKVLGKKGELTGLLQNMKNVPAQERPEIGRIVNEARESIEEAIKQYHRFRNIEDCQRQFNWNLLPS